MIVPVKWLKEFVDVKDADEVLGILLKAGFEAQKVSSAAGFKGVVAAQVLKVTAVPGTKLKNCLVSDGRELCSVVCGAPNVEKGLHVAFARVGAELPGGLKISKRKICDIVSNGMIASAKELGVGEEEAGIMVVDGKIPFGTPLSFQKDEIVDVEITPNRGDCLSVYGIAREISLFSDYTLKEPDFPEIQPEGGGDGFGIFSEDENCPLYTGCLLEGVRVAPSPKWIKDKISLMGMNPQNNIVDITNLVLFELGQPLHAFDAGKFQPKVIRISASAAGEKILLLDGVEHVLQEGTCVIRNDRKPVAAGGIMGGAETAISENTASIFVESAFFKPASVYKSAKELGVDTPSSMRFARGVDPGMVKKALYRTVRLIKETAGGRAAKIFEEGAVPERNKIKVRRKYVSSLLGMSVEMPVMEKAILHSADILERTVDEILVRPKTWRNDIGIEEDIVEEIVRFAGYEKILPKYPPLRRLPYGLPDSIRIRNRFTDGFIAAGFDEVITCDMISEGRLLQKFDNLLKIKNPLSADMNILRPVLFAGLADALRRNVARGVSDIRIFESGSVFGNDSCGIHEDEQIAGIATGRIVPLSMYECRQVDFFYVKGIIETIIGGFSEASLKCRKVNSPFLKRAFVFENTKPVLLAGEVSSEVLKSFDVKEDYLSGPVVYFEFYFKNLSGKKRVYASPPAIPSVKRDISITVNADVNYGEIVSKITETKPDFLYGIRLLDVYRGAQIGQGKKSLSFRFFFRGMKTLLQTDVDQQMSKILKCLSESFAAALRER
ncbi:MAG: phenylalanine--tRNA ligase subunit beta [bacterium]